MSTGKDSRRDPRAKVLSMTVRYKSATVAEFKENHSYDVSRGGLFIKTSSPFPPGTLLKFEVRIAEEQKVMMGVGRVTWKREEAQGPEKPAGMGVKFIKLDDESTRLIDELVTTREDAEAGFEQGARDSGIAISSPPPAREVHRSSFSDPDKSVIAHTADILRSALGATGTSKAPSLPPEDDDRRTVPNAAPTSEGVAKSESAAGTASKAGVPRSLPPRPTQSKPPTSTTAPVKAEDNQAANAREPEPAPAPEPRRDAVEAESDATSSSKTTAVSASPSEKETVSEETSESKVETEDKKPPSHARSSKRPAATKQTKRSKQEAAKKSSSRPPAAKKETNPKGAKSSSSTLTTTPPKRAQEPEKESEKTSALLWIMLGAIALAVGYYLFTQNESSKVPEPEPELEAEPEQAPAEATQPPSDTLPTEGTTGDPPLEPSAAAEPSTTAAAEGAGGAAEEAEEEPETATEPKAPVAKPRPAPRRKPPPPPPPSAAPTPAPTAPNPIAPVAPSPTSAPPPAEPPNNPPRAPTSPTPPATPKVPDAPVPDPVPLAD